MIHRYARWYTALVPTTRLRHQVTETDEIAAAIDLAAEYWPGESRSELVRRLVVAGAQRLVEGPIERTLQIELALSELAALEPCYPEGYLEGLRRDWDRVQS